MTPKELAILHRRCFTVPRPYVASEFAELLVSPGVFLMNSSHAFLLGRVIVDEAELLTLAVDPDYRRLGLAATLLDGFVTRARDLGAKKAFLEVAADNAAARALYGAHGFAATVTRKGYYKSRAGEAVDAVLMVRDL